MFSEDELFAVRCGIFSMGDEAELLRGRAGVIDDRRIGARLMIMADEYDSEAVEAASRIRARIADET